jgi:hypothetical protein
MKALEEIIKKVEFLRWNRTTEMFEAYDEGAPAPYWQAKSLSEADNHREARMANTLSGWWTAMCLSGVEPKQASYNPCEDLTYRTEEILREIDAERKPAPSSAKAPSVAPSSSACKSGEQSTTND